MRRWITRIGVSLLGLSGLAYGSQYVLPMDTTGSWFATLVATAVAGGGMVAGSQFRGAQRAVGLSVLPEIEVMQQADLHAFNHLVERFLGAAKRSPDAGYGNAVELLRQLQSEHLFNLHYRDNVPESAAETSTVSDATVAAVLQSLQRAGKSVVDAVT